MRELSSSLVVTLMIVGVAIAAETKSGAPTKAQSGKQRPSRTIKRLTALEEAIVAQELKIHALAAALRERDAVIEQLRQQVLQVGALATETQLKEALAADEAKQNVVVVAVRDDVTDVKATVSQEALALKQTEQRVATLEKPPAIHFKGITLTPGGFLEAAGIYRTHNENADVTSTFGNIPFSGSANSFLSEFRGTARQSRISLLAEGNINTWKASGYYEADFLGAAPTANEVESNSFNPRQRQLWGQVEFQNGVSFLGGQSWSLLTTNRRGVKPLQEMIPLTIDSQYAVGYNWARQWSARITKNLNDHVWAAFSVENPETTSSVTNPPPGVFGFSTSTNAQSPGSQFTLSNTPGATGISTDAAPDLLAKVAFEPGWGHYELKAIGRFFRDRVNGSNNYAAGGGAGFGVVLPASKKLDVLLEGLAGVGIGRYGDAVGPDVTLRPSGTLVPIRALQLLAGLEGHPTPQWDLYIYGGDEYYDRAAYVNSAGKGVGYGSPVVDNSGCVLESPSSTQPCQAQTRTIWQVQPGFWHRFYKGSAGTLQFGMSYSYTYRNTWFGANGIQPNAIENMIMTSFRYYLP